MDMASQKSSCEVDMQTSQNREIMSTEIKVWRKTVSRLPVTLRPSLNDQIAEWNTLFPFERKNLAGFLRSAGSFAPDELRSQMAHLCAIELKMRT